MSRAAWSMLVFGIYLVVLGVALIAVPNAILSLFGLPATSEVYIRIVGVLLFLLAWYYILSARKEMTDFFRWTVYARASIILFFTAFVALDFVKPVLILFGVVDLTAAIWTGLALRFPKRPGSENA